MIHRLLCLIFGHQRATYEHSAVFNDNDEFRYALYRCLRCNSMIWSDSEDVPMDDSRRYVQRKELSTAITKCKSEHTEVSQ